MTEITSLIEVTFDGDTLNCCFIALQFVQPLSTWINHLYQFFPFFFANLQYTLSIINIPVDIAAITCHVLSMNTDSVLLVLANP